MKTLAKMSQKVEKVHNVDKIEFGKNCGAGGTRSWHATPHRLQNPKWPPGGPKMANGVWKGV